MGREEDNELTLQAQEAQKVKALEREIDELRHENAELHHEVAELRGSGPRRGGSGLMIVGNLTKRVRMAFASSGCW